MLNNPNVKMSNKNPNIFVNIYDNHRNKQYYDKSPIINFSYSDTMQKDRGGSLNSLEVYRESYQLKKDKFKRIIDDPDFPILISSKCLHPIKGFSAKSFTNFKYNISIIYLSIFLEFFYNFLIRKSNEDKLNIKINMTIEHPQKPSKVIPVRFFSVFDGHGGEAVANKLKDNLYKQIVYAKRFYDNPIEAILKAFHIFEEKFLRSNLKLFTNNPEKSGSCAIIAIFIGNLKS